MVRVRDIRGFAVRAAFRYDPQTGELLRANGSTPAATMVRGYAVLSFRGKKYRAHRLAWLCHYGEWPKNQIDHINGIRTDNRIVNLRDVTGAQNCQNLRKPRATNRSGFLGVDFDKSNQRYRASIRVNGKNITLGRFDCPQKAHEAYIEAKRKYHATSTL